MCCHDRLTSIFISGLHFLCFIQFQSSFAQSTHLSSYECNICALDIVDDGNIATYLKTFADKRMEACCHNHGPDFSPWGEAACPESFAKIYAEAKTSVAKADGGKSGQDVLLTDSYVIKEAAPHEIEQIDKLLKAMRDRPKDGTAKPSLMSPICRKITIRQPGGIVSGGYEKVFTITARMGIANKHMFPESINVDCKGNYAYSGRDTSHNPDASTKKDRDFWKRFPDGLYITDPTIRDDFEKRLVSDTKILNDLGIMDYSLLLHIVEMCKNPIEDCAAQYDVTAPRLRPGPAGKKLKLGIFRKACVKLGTSHEGRPVYTNGKKEYLYFLNGSWMIGKDYYARDTTLYMESNSNCPNTQLLWRSDDAGKTKRIDDLRIQKIDGTFDVHSEKAIREANPHVPLAFAESLTKTYAMSYSLIDLFLPEKSTGDGRKHIFNSIGHAATRSTCRQNDIDPLYSSPYRARFLMMLGYRLDEPCMNATSYFTYFPKTKQLFGKDCAKDEGSNCKSLCKHLGLAEPNEPNGQCKVVDSCKGWMHQLNWFNWWQSSQMEVVNLLSKNVMDYQVMFFVAEITSSLKSMSADKQGKYEKCHTKLLVAMEEFESGSGSTAAAADNMEHGQQKEFTVKNCKASAVPALSMVHFKAVHDRTDIFLTSKISTSADILDVDREEDFKDLFWKLPAVASMEFEDETIDDLRKLLYSSEAPDTFFAVNVPNDLQEHSVLQSLGFMRAKEERGSYRIYIARFTQFQLREADEGPTEIDRKAAGPDEVQAFLKYELQRTIVEQERIEDPVCSNPNA